MIQALHIVDVVLDGRQAADDSAVAAVSFIETSTQIVPSDRLPAQAGVIYRLCLRNCKTASLSGLDHSVALTLLYACKAPNFDLHVKKMG